MGGGTWVLFEEADPQSSEVSANRALYAVLRQMGMTPREGEALQAGGGTEWTTICLMVWAFKIWKVDVAFQLI